MSKQESNPISKRYFHLAIAAVSLLFAGIIYAWSILKDPLAREFGFSSSGLAFTFTLMLCFFCVGGMLGSALVKRIGIRKTLLLSALCVFAGFFIVSSMSGGSIVTLYVAYGGLLGIGIGTCYNVIISATNPWFPDKKGLCSGVLMMSFGISSLVLGKAAGILINVPAFGVIK